MSTSEELLNSLSDTGAGAMGTDDELHIIIHADRSVTVPESLKNVAVQYDHDVETVTFDCPRYWDGIDMSDLTTKRVYIHYMRADGKVGCYPCPNESVTVDSLDPDVMHFTWTISRNVTEVKGSIKFLACIKDVAVDGEEVTQVHRWNSKLNTEMVVSEGLDCDVLVTDEYPDIITQLLLRMETVEAVTDAEWRTGIGNKVTTLESEVQSMKEQHASDFAGLESNQQYLDEHVSGIGNKVDQLAGDHSLDVTRLEELIHSEADRVAQDAGMDFQSLRQDLDDKFDKSGGAVTGDIELPNSAKTPDKLAVNEGYSIRQTANGADIVDGSSTEVKLIRGRSTTTLNLLNIERTYTWTGVHSKTVTLKAGKYTLSAKVGKYNGGNAPVIRIHKTGVYDRDIWRQDYTNGFVAEIPSDGAYTVYLYTNGYDASGSTGVEATLYDIMLNEGETALPWSGYFNGLKRAYINSIKATGKNIFNLAEAITANCASSGDTGLVISENPDGTFNLRGTLKFGEGKNYMVGTKTQRVYIPAGTVLRSVYTMDVVGTGSNDGGGHTSVNVIFRFADGTNNTALNSASNGTPALYTAEKDIVGLGFEYVCRSFITGDYIEMNNIRMMLNIGSTALPWEPYTEDIIELPEPLELGEYDSFNPRTGVLARRTGRRTLTGDESYHDYIASDNMVSIMQKHILGTAISNGVHTGRIASANEYYIALWDIKEAYGSSATLEDVKRRIKQRYTDGTPIEIEYELDTAEISVIGAVASHYDVTRGGLEYVVQGETDNSEYGVHPRIEQEYYISVNPDNATSKEYVNAGLAQKADKDNVDERLKDLEGRVADTSYVDEKIADVNQRIAQNGTEIWESEQRFEASLANKLDVNVAKDTYATKEEVGFLIPSDSNDILSDEVFTYDSESSPGYTPLDVTGKFENGGVYLLWAIYNMGGISTTINGVFTYIANGVTNRIYTSCGDRDIDIALYGTKDDMKLYITPASGTTAPSTVLITIRKIGEGFN